MQQYSCCIATQRCMQSSKHFWLKIIKKQAIRRQISHTYANFGYVYCCRLVVSVPVHCIQYATKNRFCQTNKTTVNSFSFCHYKQTEARISTASTLQTQPTAQTVGKKKTVAKAMCHCNSLIIIRLMPFHTNSNQCRYFRRNRCTAGGRPLR